MPMYWSNPEWIFGDAEIDPLLHFLTMAVNIRFQWFCSSLKFCLVMNWFCRFIKAEYHWSRTNCNLEPRPKYICIWPEESLIYSQKPLSSYTSKLESFLVSKCLWLALLFWIPDTEHLCKTERNLKNKPLIFIT